MRVRRKRSAHDATALLGLPADLCGPVERGELTLDEALKLAKPAGASVAEHEELRRRGGAEASPGYEDFLSSTPRLSRLERLDAEIERLSKEVDLLEDLAGRPLLRGRQTVHRPRAHTPAGYLGRLRLPGRAASAGAASAKETCALPIRDGDHGVSLGRGELSAD